MIEATTDDLLAYLADVISRAERFGATVLPPNDAEKVAWKRVGSELIMDVAIHAGILKHPIELGDLIDRRFIPDRIEPLALDGRERTAAE